MNCRSCGTCCAARMALVGPRPLPVRISPRYSPQQARRHEVRPGITGWAQGERQEYADMGGEIRV